MTVFANSLQVLEKNGGDDGTRTRDLCRDRVAWLGFTTTCKTAGTAKLRGSHRGSCGLGCGLEKVHKLRNNSTLISLNLFLDSFRVADHTGAIPPTQAAGVHRRGSSEKFRLFLSDGMPNSVIRVARNQIRLRKDLF